MDISISDQQPIKSKYHRDPLYQPLISDFLKDLPGMQSLLKTEIHQSRPKEAGHAAHQLKGTAATYGYSELANLLSELEMMIEKTTENELQENHRIKEMIHELDQVVGRMLAAR